MKISFVVPALNEELLIGRCVRSIKYEIAASGVDAEIVVVDNGSTDATALVAAVHGAKVLSEPRRGILQAKQTGYEATRYSLIAFIDADCMLRPGWIKRCLEDFADPGVMAVSGPYRYYDLPLGKYVAGAVFGVYGALSHVMATMMGGNSVLRRSALDALGGYNTDIEFWSEDTWTAVQCSKIGKVKFDLRLVVDSSGRRLKKDGYVRTFGRYVLNHFAMRLTGKPASTAIWEVR